MRKIAFLLFCSFGALQLVNAQSSTLYIEEETPENSNENLVDEKRNDEYRKVLVIPFENRMYRSDIDKKIYEKTGKDFKTIRHEIRKGLNNNVFIECKQSYDQNYGVITLFNETDPETMQDLRYIYESIAYKYKELPVEDTKELEAKGLMKVMDKAKQAFDPEPAPTNGSTTLKNGQIYTVNNTVEKYMHTSITNPNMLEAISSKYDVDLFVFVNQLDLSAAPGIDQREFESGDYRRLAKVHYTIIDRMGNEINAGAAKTLFSSTVNSPSLISKIVFPRVATQIANKLPAVKTPEERANLPEAKSITPTLSLPKIAKNKKDPPAETAKKKEEKVGEHGDIFDDY